MIEKVLVGVVSAMLSGALSVGITAANTAGRLQQVESSLARIENRLDAMAANQAKKDKD